MYQYSETITSNRSDTQTSVSYTNHDEIQRFVYVDSKGFGKNVRVYSSPDAINTKHRLCCLKGLSFPCAIYAFLVFSRFKTVTLENIGKHVMYKNIIFDKPF